MTYADMQARIIDELQRSDLATNVQSAIQDAIKHYQRRALAVNQATLPGIASVDGQREYSLPADFSRMVGDILITFDGTTVPMEARTIQQIDEMDSDAASPVEGYPAWYAIYGNSTGARFTVFPRPDANTYTFSGRYVSKLTAPSADADESFWTNDAERAIRCYAKAVLYDDVIRLPDQAEREFAKAEAEWEELVKESESRAFQGGVVPCGVSLGDEYRYRWP